MPLVAAPSKRERLAEFLQGLSQRGLLMAPLPLPWRHLDEAEREEWRKRADVALMIANA